MADDFARLLLDSIQTGINKKHKERDQSQEDARLAEMKHQHEAQVKQAQDELKQRADQFKASHDLLSKQAAVKLMEAKQSISEAALRGIPIPGVQNAPTSQGTGGAAFSPVNPQNATSQVLTLPQELGGDQINLPSPTQFATQQADLSRIIDRPKVEAKIEESRALQADLLKKQDEAKAADFIRLMAQKQIEDLRAKEDRDSRERIARGNNDATRFVAIHRNAMPQGWEGYNVQPHIQDALDGKLTREDFSRMQLPVPIKQGIEIGVKSAGGNFLDKRQQESLGDYANLQDVVGTMDELLDVLPKTQSSNKIATTVAGLSTTLDKNVSDKITKLEGMAPAIGRGINKDNRISDYDARAIAKGNFPDAYNTFQNNVDRRNGYVEKVKKAIDARLVGMPEFQKKQIKERLGLNNIKPYQIKSSGSAGPKKFKLGADEYNVPADKVAAFIKDNPGAKELN